ncbi:MAG: TolC family protein [Gammaproteobacteria bacterium]
MAAAPLAAATTSTVADPALSGWIKAVLSQNPALWAAEAAVAAAGDRVRAAEQPLFNPELEFEHETSDVNTTAGGIRQTIDWADKRGARTAVADHELKGARAGFHARRQELATELLQALADWHTADGIARAGRKQAELMAHFVRLAERRREAGDLGQTELDQAHLAAADAAFRQAVAREELIRANRDVTALTGAKAPGRPALPEQLPAIDSRRLDTERLLDELPSHQVALARVAAADAAVRLSIREKRPDPTVGIRAGKEDSESLAGVTLSVPLFVRNRFRAEVDVANAELIQATREADSHRQQSRADLLAAAESYRNARQAWNTWTATGAPRLSQRTELLERLWQAGELGTTDYLVQLKQALDTEVGAIEQRGRMWRAWVAWLAAAGRIDQWLNLAGDEQ